MERHRFSPSLHICPNRTNSPSSSPQRGFLSIPESLLAAEEQQQTILQGSRQKLELYSSPEVCLRQIHSCFNQNLVHVQTPIWFPEPREDLTIFSSVTINESSQAKTCLTRKFKTAVEKGN